MLRSPDGYPLSIEEPDQNRSMGMLARAEVGRYPIRMYIGVLLSDRPMTAHELAAAADLPVSTIRRHLRAMREAGAVEVAETRQRRGTAEQVFSTSAEYLFSEEEIVALTRRQRRQVNGYILKGLIAEASRSLVSNPAASAVEGDDTCVARVPMRVDEEGWKELARFHAETLKRLIELRELIESRLRESGAEPIRATSALLWFEATPPR